MPPPTTAKTSLQELTDRELAATGDQPDNAVGVIEEADGDCYLASAQIYSRTGRLVMPGTLINWHRKHTTAE